MRVGRERRAAVIGCRPIDTPARRREGGRSNTLARSRKEDIAMELKGKVAVVTGGAGGIGKAMARAFLAEGAKAVVLADLDAAQVAAAAREIGCDGIACDVTNEA